MRYLTWDGCRLFRKPETAADHAIKTGVDPQTIQILTGGKLVKPEPWEIDELTMHIRDQSC